jgi:hypothetical protein
VNLVFRPKPAANADSKSEPSVHHPPSTIHKSEDLDIPTYYRRGVPLN